ncbi:MAG: hypothetical protein NC548_22705 [Lachnospiraceae bacterium]|nr:hypothetical protein [Lachnospiraceae bacterium]
MGRLYFQSGTGERRLIADNLEEKNVYAEMTEYVRKLNPNYKIYYVNSWTKDGTTHYDVGSWSEQFLYEEDKDES